MQIKERFSFYPLFVVIIAALGGFLFGYHSGVISGALIFISPEFQLKPSDEGLVVSIILLGALAGALCASYLADRFGRKKTIFLIALIFSIGTWIIFNSTSYEALLWGRAISGFSMGIVSLTIPLYLAEVSPPQLRGAFVACYQLAIAVGILAAYLINYLYADLGSWRVMFLIGIIPALLQLVGSFFIPETPAWLLANHRQKDGLAALKKLRLEKPEKKAKPSEKQGSWKDVFDHRLRFVLFLGLALSSFQQITGINAVIYYTPKIFQMANFTSASGAIVATMGIGLINAIVTGCSVWFLDRWGRRPLLLIGLAGMVISLLVFASAFVCHAAAIDLISVISLMSYVCFFAIGLGPVTWVVISEIYPQRVRGKAMTLAVIASWTFNYLVAFTFLDLTSLLGCSGVFYFYAAIGVLGGWFVWRFIPETKGKTLEEIESSLIP